MKIHRILPAHRRFERAFTLIELLVVIAIIAVLAALSIGAFTMATTTSARNRTKATLQAIVSALERYKEANGDFPTPMDTSGNHSLTTTTGAQMLYQAITADGYDQIKLATPPSGHASSNGTVDPAMTSFTINGDFIPAKQSSDGSSSNTSNYRSKLNATLVDKDNKFYLVDGFGHPFQYDKAAPTGQQATTINPTYDVWSYANIGQTDSQSASLEDKSNAKNIAIWITNWQ